MKQNDALKLRKLRWLRRLILLWPPAVTAIPLVYIYWTEFHPTVRKLIDAGHPVTHWLGFFEFASELFPMFVLLFVFVSALTQTLNGIVFFLFLLLFLIFAGAYGCYETIFRNAPGGVSLESMEIFLAVCLGLLVLFFVTLYAVDKIDKRIEALKEEEKQGDDSPE